MQYLDAPLLGRNVVQNIRRDDEIWTTDHVVSHDVITNVTSLVDDVTYRVTSSIMSIFAAKR